MVGYDATATQLSSWQYGLAGATSGFLTRLTCQPLDVLKIRFQLQHEPVRGGAGRGRYSGVAQAATRIVREEGVAALWKGHLSAQLLSVTYGAVQFACFEMLTREAQRRLKPAAAQATVAIHFGCGAAAGVAASAASLPLDVIRTRLVAQGEPRYYRGIGAAAAHMLRHEGAAVFFAGLTPTLLQTAPFTSLQFGAFAVCERLACQWTRLEQRPATRAFFCGVVAGLAAKTVVYPLDVAKKRLQVQGPDQEQRGGGRAVPRFRGLVHCLAHTLRQEGVRGVYKGLAPASIKAMVTSGLHFAFYDLTVRVMRQL